MTFIEANNLEPGDSIRISTNWIEDAKWQIITQVTTNYIYIGTKGIPKKDLAKTSYKKSKKLHLLYETY